jgi:L-rhamnose mutarotase
VDRIHTFRMQLMSGDQRDELPTHPIMRRWWDCVADPMKTHEDHRPRERPLVAMFHLP